jgi:hypothetical protein
LSRESRKIIYFALESFLQTERDRKTFTVKTWRPLTKEELTDLSSGDKVVLRRSSRDAFQWHVSQRLRPEVITFTEVKYVQPSKRADAALVLKEDSDTAIWVGTVEMGRYEEAQKSKLW